MKTIPGRLILNISLTSLFLIPAAVLEAADWPAWRGPKRDGISQESGLMKEWPKEGPPLRWQVKDIGSGYSTPAVVQDRLYLLSNTGVDNEFVLVLSARDGKKIWNKTIGKVGNPNQQPAYPASRSTPTVEGDVMFVLGSDGDLACLKASDGAIQWQKSLRTDFGGSPGKWAYAESPLIDGDVLVCTPGGSEATIIALNKKNGEIIWKSAIPGGDQAGYASAIIATIGGKKQYIQFLQNGVVGVDAKTGKFQWRYDKTSKSSPANIPTPVAEDGLVYSGTGRGGGGLVKITPKEDAFEAEQVYFSPKLPTAIGGAVKIGKYLYGTGGRSMVCADFATGELKWEEVGIGAASLMFADGRFYLHGENGEVALVEATPEGYREKGRFSPPDQPDRGISKAWAYPVVANGKLYIRDANCLWAYDVKGGT